MLSLSNLNLGRLSSVLTIRFTPFSDIMGAIVSCASLTTSFMSFSCTSNSVLPDSSFSKSKTLLINLASLSTFLFAIVKYSFCSSLITPVNPSRITAILSSMVVKGVRNSCETIAVKFAFASAASLILFSASLCFVISSEISIKRVITPSEFLIGDTELHFQYSPPSFFLLRSSPCHSHPEVIVSHICLYISGAFFPDFRMRGFLPMTSSRA